MQDDDRSPCTRFIAFNAAYVLEEAFTIDLFGIPKTNEFIILNTSIISLTI
jgi:hypothetical protein